MIYDPCDATFYTFLRHSWQVVLLRDGSLAHATVLSLVAQPLSHALTVSASVHCWRCVSKSHANALCVEAQHQQKFASRKHIIRGENAKRHEHLGGNGVSHSLVIAARGYRLASAIKRLVDVMEAEHARVRNAIAHGTLSQYLEPIHVPDASV